MGSPGQPAASPAWPEWPPVLEVTSRCIRIIRKPVPLLGSHGLVVAVPHVVGHCFVQRRCATCRDSQATACRRMDEGAEQRLPFGVDGQPLLGANHEGLHALTGDAAIVGKASRSSGCISRMNWSVLPWCGVADSSNR